jgi:hypothetical protein
LVGLARLANDDESPAGPLDRCFRELPDLVQEQTLGVMLRKVHQITDGQVV